MKEITINGVRYVTNADGWFVPYVEPEIGPLEAQLLTSVSAPTNCIRTDADAAAAGGQGVWVTANNCIGANSVLVSSAGQMTWAANPHIATVPAPAEPAPIAVAPGPRKPAPALCVEAHRSEPIDADRARAATLAMCRGAA